MLQESHGHLVMMFVAIYLSSGDPKIGFFPCYVMGSVVLLRSVFVSIDDVCRSLMAKGAWHIAHITGFIGIV